MRNRLHSRRWLVFASFISISFFLIFAVGNVFKSSMSETDPNQTRSLDEPVLEPNVGVKELSLQVAMDPKEFAVLNQLKQQSQSAHPDVTLKLENLGPDAAYAKWKKAAQLGEAPDLMLLDNSWVTEFAALGYLSPIDSLLTSDLISQQMEQMVNELKWNGYLWGVPKDVDLYGIAYSTKKLAELGADKPPSLAEDLLALHAASSNPDEGKYGLYADLGDAHAFMALAKSMGGVKSQGKAGPLLLSEPTLNKSLETLFAGTKTAGKDEPKGLGRTFPLQGSASWKPWEVLQQGRMLGILTTLSEYKRHAADGILLAMLPLPKGETVWKSAWLAGRSFVISSRSAYPKEAFDWIRELTTAAANNKFWKDGDMLPSVTSSYTVANLRNDPSVQVLAAYLEKEDGVPKPPMLSRQLQQLAAQLNQLWRGDINWKAFTEQTEQLWAGSTGAGNPAPTPSGQASALNQGEGAK